MAETEFVRTDRIYIDRSVMDIYQQLKSEKSVPLDQAPFDTFKDVFMLAACLGYQNGRRSKLPSGEKTDIRVSIFKENDMVLLKAIAIAETGDVEVLSRQGEILVIAEEYAHAGIQDVKTRLLDERGKSLWNLVELVNSSKIIHG